MIPGNNIDFSISEVRFQDLQENEIKAAIEFIQSVFDEFIAPDYSPEGVISFMNYIQPSMMKRRLRIGEAFAITAFDNDQPVGIIEMRNGNHLSLLFVRKEYQGRGIGRRLFENALERCRMANPALGTITVKSSPYAVPIYEKLGFRRTGPEEIKDGIRFTPMACTV